MCWKTLRRSRNVDDRRGRGRTGLGIPLPIGGGRGGIPVIVLLVIVYFVGGPEMLSLFVGGNGTATGPVAGSDPVDDESGQFVAAILASTEDEWERLFSGGGRQFRAGIRDRTRSGSP